MKSVKNRTLSVSLTAVLLVLLIALAVYLALLIDQKRAWDEIISSGSSTTTSSGQENSTSKLYYSIKEAGEEVACQPGAKSSVTYSQKGDILLF